MYGAVSVSALLRGDSLNAVLLGGAVYAEIDYANNNTIYGGVERSSDTDSNCIVGWRAIRHLTCVLYKLLGSLEDIPNFFEEIFMRRVEGSETSSLFKLRFQQLLYGWVSAKSGNLQVQIQITAMNNLIELITSTASVRPFILWILSTEYSDRSMSIDR